MYQIEWNKLEAAINKKLSNKINKIQYIGRIYKCEPEVVNFESTDDGASKLKHHDPDYDNTELQLNLWIKNNEDINTCSDLLLAALKDAKYTICSKSIRNNESGEYIIKITFKRNGPWGLYIYDWDEEELNYGTTNL